LQLLADDRIIYHTGEYNSVSSKASHMEDKTLNILLIKDDAVEIAHMKQALEKSKIAQKLYVAANGLEALQLLRPIGDLPPLMPAHRRLILLDLNSDRRDGIAFLQTLRFDPQLKSIPVVVLTSSKCDRVLLEAYELNVGGYIVKPVTSSSFTEMLTTLTQYWALCEMV
jgi:CheY-like chemotaxis protein